MRIYGSNIKKNYNKNNKHHKKIFKFLLISFSILVLLGNIIVLIFFCILSTIDVNENPHPFEKRYDSKLLIDSYIGYKEPIYSCLFSCMIYSEYYYENASEQFEDNTNYQKVTNDNITLLKKLFSRFSSFSEYEEVLSFKYKEQLKLDDLFYLDYKKIKMKKYMNIQFTIMIRKERFYTTSMILTR